MCDRAQTRDRVRPVTIEAIHVLVDGVEVG